MGKTYRYDPENEDIFSKDHRLPRNQRQRAQREVTKLMRPHLPPVLIQSEIPSLLPKSWIPPKMEDRTEGPVRQSRIDLLHTYGELMIGGAYG